MPKSNMEDENIFFEDINEYDQYVDYLDSLKDK